MSRSMLFVIIAAFAAAAPATAQQPTSELHGRVLDQQGAVLPGVAFGGDYVNINGQDRRNASYTLDGAGNNEMNNGGFSGPQTRIPVEAIQELQMVTSQFDAEFGSTSGGVVNAISKQGTNQLRGSAFGFFKDTALTSKDIFVKTPRPREAADAGSSSTAARSADRSSPTRRISSSAWSACSSTPA